MLTAGGRALPADIGALAVIRKGECGCTVGVVEIRGVAASSLLTSSFML